MSIHHRANSAITSVVWLYWKVLLLLERWHFALEVAVSESSINKGKPEDSPLTKQRSLYCEMKLGRGVWPVILAEHNLASEWFLYGGKRPNAVSTIVISILIHLENKTEDTEIAGFSA